MDETISDDIASIQIYDGKFRLHPQKRLQRRDVPNRDLKERARGLGETVLKLPANRHKLSRFLKTPKKVTHLMKQQTIVLDEGARCVAPGKTMTFSVTVRMKVKGMRDENSSDTIAAFRNQGIHFTNLFITHFFYVTIY